MEADLLQSKTIKDLILDSKLSKLDTRLLLRHILKFSQVELIIHDDYLLTLEEYAKYVSLYDECISGVPLNYIVGYKEFYSREFIVTRDTLIPRPETELLVDTVLNMAAAGSNILDLGTGSGCIAISCKLEDPTLNVVASDKYSATLDIARKNAANLAADVKFIQSDWLDNISGKFDIIVSNPPYIEANDSHLVDLQFEPQAALTDFDDGLGCFRQIVLSAGEYLVKNGYLIFEHGYNQALMVSEIMSKHGFSQIVSVMDYADLPRITYGVFE